LDSFAIALTVLDMVRRCGHILLRTLWNGKGEVTAVIHHMAGLPDSEGKKLKNE